MGDLERRGGYDVVMADPPWSYYGDPGKMAAAGKHYGLMCDVDLLSFPMGDWLAPRGVLFLWATCPRLDFAVRCLASWGLVFRGVGFVWVKTRRDGGVIGAQGVRPSIVKPTTELCLVASRVARGRPLRLLDEGVPQVVLAPRGRHSEKPVEVFDRVERLFGDVSRVELFARVRRPGWDAWGDEL